MGRATSHPINRVLGKALGSQFERVDWYRFLTVSSLVPEGVRFTPSRGRIPPENEEFANLLRDSTHRAPMLVQAWMHSELFLTAPLSWPSRVAMIMRRVSPYEFSYGYLANAETLTPEQDLLVAFASGMDLALLSDLLHEPPGLLEDQLVTGTKQFMARPWFRIWALGVDWGQARLPPEISESFLERIHYGAELARDPSLVPARLLSRMVESQRFMAYAMHVAPKKQGFLPRPVRYAKQHTVRPQLG